MTMRVKEPISQEEAVRLVEQLATPEAREEIEKAPVTVDWLVRVSLRAGLVLRGDVPCAIVGVYMETLRPILWFVPLEGLRGHVREFIRFMKTIEFKGPVWTYASDPKARLVRFGGGRQEGELWRLR